MRLTVALRTTILLLVAVLLGGVMSAPVRAATEDDLQQIESRLDELDQRVAELRGRYVKPIELRDMEQFAARFERAVFYYKDGDYVHSSIIFSDLLDYPNVEKRSEYYDLLWYYGSSLAENKNYLTAREYLEKVLEYGRSGEHYTEAVILLIRISVDLERFQDAERYYAMMSGEARGWDIIQYAYGKSLHKKGYTSKALRTFSEISAESPKRPYADYFIGTILVENAAKSDPLDAQKLEEALVIFQRLRDIAPETKDLKELKQLAILASARILFELKRLDEALTLYRLIPVESPFFDQAYYEISWIYIQEEKYTEAANTLDILLLAMPDSIYAPQSQVLKANILLMEGRYPSARNDFETVINKYQTVVDTMDRLLTETRGEEAETIQRVLFSERSTLPPVAMAWLAREQDVGDALALSRKLDKSRDDAEEAQRIIDSLRQHLTQDSKANLFPTLREGRENGLEVEHELTETRQELVVLGNALVGDSLTAAEQARLRELQARRRELEAEYAAVPKTVKERNERREQRIAAIEEVDKQVYQITLQMDGLEEMSRSIMKRHEQLRGNPQMSQRFLKQVQQEVAQIQQDMDEMLSELQRLQRQVREETEARKIGDASNTRDKKIREELDAVIAEEKTLLAQMRTKLGPKAVVLFDRIERAKTRSDDLDKRVDTFFLDMEALVAERVEGFVRQVEREEKMMQDYIASLTTMQDDARKTAAEVAYANLKSVRDRFYAIYLKANVGLIDIAWERHQGIRRRIDGLLEMRGDDLQNLTKSFEGLR